MKTNLRDYLKKEGLSTTAFAKKAGIPQPVIHRFLAGTRGLSLKTALKIQTATDGMIKPEDLDCTPPDLPAKDSVASCHE